MTHDPKCAEFAHDWLGPKATKSRVTTLANAVQKLVEDYCEEWDEYDREQEMLRGYSPEEKARI